MGQGAKEILRAVHMGTPEYRSSKLIKSRTDKTGTWYDLFRIKSGNGHDHFEDGPRREQPRDGAVDGRRQRIGKDPVELSRITASHEDVRVKSRRTGHPQDLPAVHIHDDHDTDPVGQKFKSVLLNFTVDGQCNILPFLGLPDS